MMELSRPELRNRAGREAGGVLGPGGRRGGRQKASSGREAGGARAGRQEVGAGTTALSSDCF